MSFRLLSKNPIATVTIALGSTNITTSAWAQLLAKLPKACTAIEIFNPSGSTIQVSTGKAGFESSSIIPYTILPGGSNILLPVEISGGVRISVKAVDSNATGPGQFTLNFFG